MALKKRGNQIVYEAKVPDQNEGGTIKFILNPEVDSIFSFENSNHDFPKKIQYKVVDDNQLRVIVLSDDNSGFSYLQIRQ